jgi:hypothetical protein
LTTFGFGVFDSALTVVGALTFGADFGLREAGLGAFGVPTALDAFWIAFAVLSVDPLSALRLLVAEEVLIRLRALAAFWAGLGLAVGIAVEAVLVGADAL